MNQIIHEIRVNIHQFLFETITKTLSDKMGETLLEELK